MNDVNRSRFAALFVAMAAAASSVLAAQSAQPAPGAAKAGQPTLHVACNASGSLPTFRATVVNPGDREMAVLLGYTPGSPQPQVVNALTVAAIRPATGATEDYLYVNPKYAGYSGRADPWIVALKPGATYEFEVALKDFISTMSFNPLDPATAVGARLVLDARPVAKQPGRVWTGKIEAPIDGCF